MCTIHICTTCAVQCILPYYYIYSGPRKGLLLARKDFFPRHRTFIEHTLNTFVQWARYIIYLAHVVLLFLFSACLHLLCMHSDISRGAHLLVWRVLWCNIGSICSRWARSTTQRRAYCHSETRDYWKDMQKVQKDINGWTPKYHSSSLGKYLPKLLQK